MLAVLAQWYSHGSEQGFLRYVRKHWQAYFPRLLSQSAFNLAVLLNHAFGRPTFAHCDPFE